MNKVISLILFLLVVGVYLDVAGFDFVNFDDPDYVYANPQVRDGLSLDAVRWAFTSGEAANWFPLTRLSHILDVKFFDLNAGAHHLISVVIHALASVMLFAFLYRATRARFPSLFVACVFAFHPLHVESVAWISERKDVLSAFLWFFTLWVYVRYTEKPDALRYALVLVVFALGLMSKPMIVTLPFVLLLLDFWPLRRMRNLGALIREKIPFFVLAAAASIVAYLVQSGSGAVSGLDVHPVRMRLANAIVSYAVYVGKTFWPSRLAVFYPYPATIPALQILISLILLIGISALVWTQRRSRPWLAVGWLWFLGTLVPVIGLIQVGAQARADRYTYVPMVGLAIMIAWSLEALPSRPVYVLSALLGGILIGVVHSQLGVWANSGTLFRHAIDSGYPSDIAYHNLGNFLAENGKIQDAIRLYYQALSLNPDSPRTHTDLGSALSQDPNRLNEAVVHYEAALRISDSAITRNNLANTLSKMGKMPEAIAEYQTALRLKPDYAEARNNLAQVQSNAAEMQYNLGVDLARSSTPVAAIAHFEEALRLKPDYVDAHNNLGVVLAGAGRVQEAISHFENALRIDPNSVDAHVNLGIALSGIPGRRADAIRHFEAALHVKPDREIRQMLDRLERQP